VAVPSVVILNTSNEQYFLPSEPIDTMEQLVQFINGVLNGSAQVQIFSSFLPLFENAEGYVLIAVYLFIYLFICMRVIRITTKVLNRIA